MSTSTVTDPDGNELHGVKAIAEKARQRREAVQSRIDKAKDLKGTTRDVLTDWARRDLTVKRTVDQWSPWAISGAVFTIAAANQIAAQMSGDAAATGAYTLGSTVALLGAVVAAMRTRNRFVNRLIPQNPTQARWMALCAGVAMAWLAIAVVVGITPTTGPVLGVVLMASTLVLARRHWRHHRIPDPDSLTPQLPPSSLKELAGSDPEDTPTEKGPPAGAQYYLDQWTNIVAPSRNLMPDTVLAYEETITSEAEDGTVRTIGYRFRLHLPEDGITFSGVLNGVGRIQNALHIPQKNISPEQIPEDICEDPAQVWLKIITHSPIQKSVPMLSSRYRCEYDEDGRVKRGWVDMGPYSSGDGNAEWTLYSGGDSMWSGLIIGGTGSGKTVVLDTLGMSAAANDHTVLWYADGQRGGSSNFLPTISDFTALTDDPEEGETWEDMITAMETIAKARANENRKNGAKDPTQRGFHPTPERPGIMVIIDECQEIITNPKIAKRIERLSKIVRKVGMSLVLATQSADNSSFAYNTNIRDQLVQGNAIVLRTTGGSQAGFVGLTLDPTQLPKIPGFGFMVSGGRMAPFRSVFHTNYPRLWRMCGYDLTRPDEIAVGAANIATEGRYAEQAAPDPEVVMAQAEATLDKYRQAARGHLDLVQAHKDEHPDPEEQLTGDLEDQITDMDQENSDIAKMLEDLNAETEAQADIDRIAETVSVLGSGQKAALDAIARVKLNAQDRAEQYGEPEGPVAVCAADLAQERGVSRQRATTLISALVERDLIADTGQGYELTTPALAYMERYGREMAPA